MQSRSKKSSARGFTLIEMMIVVLIIITLIAILIPVVGAMRTRARAAATRERMATIGSGLEAYRIDFGGYYPQSAPGVFAAAVPNITINSGSAMLAEALLGYLNGNYDGAGVGAGDTVDFGFRLHKGQGRIFGPYTDANQVPKSGSAASSGSIRVDMVASNPRMVYLDGWGNEILYYRATGKDVLNPSAVFGSATTAVFVNSDNWTLGGVQYDPATNGTSKFFYSILAGTSNTASPSTVWGRDQYLLVSAGQDLVAFNDDDVCAPAK